MTTALVIIFLSAILFCYWAKRVFTLVFRPEEAPAILDGDLRLGRDVLFTALRSIFFPSLAICG